MHLTEIHFDAVLFSGGKTRVIPIKTWSLSLKNGYLYTINKTENLKLKSECFFPSCFDCIAHRVCVCVRCINLPRSIRKISTHNIVFVLQWWITAAFWVAKFNIATAQFTQTNKVHGIWNAVIWFSSSKCVDRVSTKMLTDLTHISIHTALYNILSASAMQTNEKERKMQKIWHIHNRSNQQRTTTSDELVWFYFRFVSVPQCARNATYHPIY